MKRKVLILCTGNSCRSQMAEGALRHFHGDRFEVFSAGTRPCVVNPLAIRVMAEAGIDISGHRSKHVGEFKGKAMDYVITVCDNAKEACPVFPGGTRILHWPFPDPPHAQAESPEVLQAFRDVRDLVLKKFKEADRLLT